MRKGVCLILKSFIHYHINKYKFFKLFHNSNIIKYKRRMDSEEDNIIPARRTHRLTLDSSEEQRKEQELKRQQEQYQRQREERRKRKQEKRKEKEERQKQAEIKLKREEQDKRKELQKYNDPAKLLEMDSEQSAQFKRIERKIEIMYPQFSRKKKKYDDDSDQESSEQSSDEQVSESQSQKPKKTKKIAKKKNTHHHGNQDSHTPPHKKPKAKSAVKVQHELTKKQSLVQEVARRWWYVMPQWPPIDFDYETELKKYGYRVVKVAQWRIADEVVDGLVKVTQLDGYRGVYRSKYKIIDVRPKGQYPSINYFNTLSERELSQMFKKALTLQIEDLKKVQFKQSGDEDLILELEKKLINLK